ncbi:ricin-type beta-trefoil lectin domain protein [Actinomadura syzygii]|uniref:RICIN domain-containing protein n=1 Tax=Actinomadura syzygii TaxID=1427538 RepID=UPI001CA30207|nr:RICIN domain-containing protein [Actinomadura syzygii]
MSAGALLTTGISAVDANAATPFDATRGGLAAQAQGDATIAATHRLKNVATGYCLDSNSAQKVYAHGCNGGNYQRWSISGGRLKDVATGYCLDSNSARKVYTHGCNGGNYQKWAISGGRLKNVATGYCLDSNKAQKVYTHSCNGGSYQKWRYA